MKADFIERDFLRLILDVMQRDNALAVRVSLETGLRIGDVLALTEDKLSPSGALETVCQKTGKPFHGAVTERTAADLRANACGGWLFPSPRDVSKHKSRQAVWADIKKSARKCGVKVNVTPHTARKVHGVEVFRSKGIGEVQRELQHDRVQTSLLYAFADVLTGERSKTEQEVPLNEVSHEEAAAFLSAVVKNLGGAGAVYDAIMAALEERGCE